MVLMVIFEFKDFTLLVRDVFRFVVDNRFHHGYGRRVQGAIDAADFPHYGIYFRNGLKGQILFLQDIQSFPDGGMGHGCRHVKEGSFIQRRHKLFAQAGPDDTSQNNNYNRHG